MPHTTTSLRAATTSSTSSRPYAKLGVDHLYLTVSSEMPAAMLHEMADVVEQTGRRRRSSSRAGGPGVD
jgi:hypothetical protein